MWQIELKPQTEHATYECKRRFGDVMYVLMLNPRTGGGGGDLDVTSVTGRWAGDRVVMLGEYTKHDEVPGLPGNDDNPPYYVISGDDGWTDISETVRNSGIWGALAV